MVDGLVVKETAFEAVGWIIQLSLNGRVLSLSHMDQNLQRKKSLLKKFFVKINKVENAPLGLVQIS